MLALAIACIFLEGLPVLPAAQETDVIIPHTLVSCFQMPPPGLLRTLLVMPVQDLLDQQLGHVNSRTKDTCLWHAEVSWM